MPKNNARKSYSIILLLLSGIGIFGLFGTAHAENLPSYHVIQAGTLFEDFETIGDWAVGSGSGTIDPNFVKTGSGSLKITTNLGSAATAIKSISLSGISGGVGFWVYVVDSTKTSYVSIYISSQTDFSKYFLASSPALHNGWNFVSIGRDDWLNTGGESWDNTMVKLKMRTQSVPGQVGVVYFDSLYCGIYTEPKCVIAFDDGYANVYSTAYPYMENYGFKGTCFIVSSFIGTNGFFMTLANLTTLYNDGWDISNHTYTHPHLNTLTEAEQETEIETCADYLYNNGFTRNEMYNHFAYPYGEHNADTFAAFAAQGIITAGAGAPGYNFNVNEFAAPYLLKVKTVSKDTSLATAENYIDTAIAGGETVILAFHHIVATPTDDIQWSTANFQALMDYLETKKSQIDVVTRSEWCVGLTGSLNAPTIGIPTVNSPTSITWNWIDNSELEDSYRVHYVNNGGGTAHDVNGLSPQTTSWTDSNLAPNTQYSVHIHAYRADIGESPASDVSTSIYTLANQVTALTAAKDAGYGISLTWTNQGQSGVKIEQDANCDGYDTTLYDSSTSTPALPYQVFAMANMCYKFRISSYNGDGTLNTTSIPETSFTTTSPSALAAPTGLVAARGNRKISLGWDNSIEPNLAGYNVYRSTVSGGGYVRLNSLPLSSPDYSDNTVTHNVTYHYVVDAVDTTLNESVFSSEVTGAWLYGDMTEDGIVDMNDLPEFFSYWLSTDCNAISELDLNGDCIIDFYEFSQMAVGWLAN